MPPSRHQTRGDSDSWDKEEREVLQTSCDTISEDDKLRSSFPEQIRRDVRETQSCRDGFQHDYEAVRLSPEMQIADWEKKRGAGEAVDVQSLPPG